MSASYSMRTSSSSPSSVLLCGAIVGEVWSIERLDGLPNEVAMKDSLDGAFD
jgi:hypothetical protein